MCAVTKLIDLFPKKSIGRCFIFNIIKKLDALDSFMKSGGDDNQLINFTGPYFKLIFLINLLFWMINSR